MLITLLRVFPDVDHCAAYRVVPYVDHFATYRVIPDVDHCAAYRFVPDVDHCADEHGGVALHHGHVARRQVVVNARHHRLSDEVQLAGDVVVVKHSFRAHVLELLASLCTNQ
jgi:hypothetical protein